MKKIYVYFIVTHYRIVIYLYFVTNSCMIFSEHRSLWVTPKLRQQYSNDKQTWRGYIQVKWWAKASSVRALVYLAMCESYIWTMNLVILSLTYSLVPNEVSRTGTSNCIPPYMWDVITCPCPWYLPKDIWRTGTSNCIPQYLWDVITCPCPWYLPKDISRTGTSNCIPQYLWDVITSPCPWYLPKDIWRTGTSNCIPPYMWDAITCPCPWYLLLALLNHWCYAIKSYMADGNVGYVSFKVWLTVSCMEYKKILDQNKLSAMADYSLCPILALIFLMLCANHVNW